MSNWKQSQGPSRSENGHSTKEIEHRFTDLEAFTESSTEDSSELHQIVEKHSDRLSLHERILLGLLMGVATLLQDKFPVIAAALKALMNS